MITVTTILASLLVGYIIGRTSNKPFVICAHNKGWITIDKREDTVRK